MRELNIALLTNVVKKDGKTVARCPACAARGGDATGNNLVVFPDGKFGCQAGKGDKKHNRLILSLAGVEKAGSREALVPIRRVVHPPSTVIKIVGRLGRVLPSDKVLDAPGAAESEAKGLSEIKVDPTLPEHRPPRPTNDKIDSSGEAPPPTVANPSGRPKVPQVVRESLERLGCLSDGRGIDQLNSDGDGRSTPVERSRGKDTAGSVENLPVAHPNGTTIGAACVPSHDDVGWRDGSTS